MNSRGEPIARGGRPDAEDATRLILLKGTRTLRATYQVRLLAFMALKAGKKLVIVAPEGFRPAPSLEALMLQTGPLIQIEAP